MKKQFWLLTLLTACLISFGGCSDSDSGGKGSKVYDPNIPVEVSTFMPDSGGIRAKFVIKGSNFGSDISKIQVLFKGGRKATVISSNGDMIYCLVPRQDGGNNSVAVVVDKDTTLFQNKTFSYIVAQNVSIATGKSASAGLVDGTLVDAKFNRIGGLGVLTGNNVIIFESWDNNVRLAAMDDNQVITLSKSFSAGKPAITKDRKTAYAIKKVSPHAVYRFSQDNLWAAQRISTQITNVTGDIWAAALDDEEKWLYFRDGAGKFGRIELANVNNVEILNPSCGSVSSSGTVSYLVYNPRDDHFYLSIQYYQGIYRISKDGQTVEQYAGFNGIGAVDGPRKDASFKNPSGMAVDSEGNLYVADSGGYIIRKISFTEGSVTTIAGQYNIGGSLNGIPLQSTLNYPYDIAADQDDNFYIGESWGTEVRRLAIE